MKKARTFVLFSSSVAFVLAVLLLSASGEASGSSTVHADSKYFRVQMESVRKIFAAGDGEGEWHADWKKEHQPIVNRLKKKLEAEIEPLAETYALLPYQAKLPVVLDDAEDTDEGIEAVKSHKPFQLRFRYEMTSVSVVVAKMPSKAQRRELRKALGRHQPTE
jgi:hypothetical protein